MLSAFWRWICAPERANSPPKRWAGGPRRRQVEVVDGEVVHRTDSQLGQRGVDAVPDDLQYAAHSRGAAGGEAPHTGPTTQNGAGAHGERLHHVGAAADAPVE